MSHQSLDLHTNQTVLIAFCIILAAILIADVVIVVRMLIYKIHLRDAEPIPVPTEPTPLWFDLPLPFDGAIVSYEPAPPGAEAVADEVLPTEDVFAAPIPEAVISPKPQLKPPFAQTWSLVDPFFGFQFVQAAGIAFFLIAGVVLGIGAALFHGHAPPPAPGQDPIQAGIESIMPFALVASLAATAAAFVGTVAFYLNRYGLKLSDIGLRKPTKQQVLLGICLGFALLIASGMIETGVEHLIPKATLTALHKFSDNVDASAIFGKAQGVPFRVLFALCGAVLAPIGEEVFFRGFLYNGLKRRMKIPAAILLSGFLFALMHGNPLALVPITVMGSILALTYEKTRNLWVTITMHMVNNGAAFIELALSGAKHH